MEAMWSGSRSWENIATSLDSNSAALVSRVLEYVLQLERVSELVRGLAGDKISDF